MTKRSIFFLVGAILVFASSVSKAQYQKGDQLLNLGIGLNTYYAGGIPLSASYEVGITKEISIGASLDYLAYRYAYPGGKWNYSVFYVGGRGSFHFTDLLDIDSNEIDLYAGVNLGYRSFAWRDNYVFGNVGFSNRYGSTVFLGLYAGCRYYFTDKVGVFGEVGAGGSSNAKLGLALRLK